MRPGGLRGRQRTCTTRAKRHDAADSDAACAALQWPGLASLIRTIYPGERLSLEPLKPAAVSTSFAAMRSPSYRWQFSAYVLAMMADNIEHVISYWVMFQKFQSPALAGFAVVSHWLPFLLFSVAVGALADRFDPRRIIQCGMAAVHRRVARLGLFSSSPTRCEMWHAMVLLVLHGCAGVLWQTSSQLLLYDIVGAGASAERGAAERDRALSRRAGRARGRRRASCWRSGRPRHPSQHAVLPADRALAVRAPYGPRSAGIGAARDASRCAASPTSCRPSATSRAHRILASMTLLAGCASFLSATPTRRRCRASPHDLGHGDPGVSYSVLLAADAAGALLAGLLLEAADCCSRAAHRARARDALVRRRCRLRVGRATTRWRSRCCSSPASSSCRSTPWRRRWCS